MNYRRMLVRLVLVGLVGLPAQTFPQATNPSIVQKTLNPLPASVLIPSSAFTGSLISLVPTPANAPDSGLQLVWSGTSGDLTNDGYPEVVISGWYFQGGNASGTPVATPLYLFSTNATGTIQLDPQQSFGISSLPGTNSPRILDLDRNGLNDFVYLGYNESPFVPTMSQAFLQTSPGTFSATTLPGPKIASHNSNVCDFNHDGYPDIVVSTYYTDGTYFDPAFFAHDPHYEVLILYINNRDGTFTPHAMRYTKPISQGLSVPDYGVNGSASACGDLNGDGKPDVVIADARVLLSGTSGPSRGDTFLISNISLGNREAWGDITKLPAPYFEDKPEYASYQSAYPGQQSHDIHVDIVDIDNDGRPDILVSGVIQHPTAGLSAGVLQILRNTGNLQFEDVTETSLYNFFLGKGAGHQVEFMDVNGDGFPDILMPQNGAGTPETWANQVLVNTGTGKFVQAMWSEFREMTLSQQNLVPSGVLPIQQDFKYVPYLLPDGRLGFVTQQKVCILGPVPCGDPLSFWSNASFDYRANQPLSTGPNGTNPALQGVPGFSEYFYLTEYPDAAAVVAAGQYASGLAHYLAVGKDKGYEAFAPNATIRGSAQVDTLTLNGPRSHFAISEISGGHQLKDNVGRYGTLKLLNVERVQFSDTLMALVENPVLSLDRDTVAAGDSFTLQFGNLPSGTAALALLFQGPGGFSAPVVLPIPAGTSSITLAVPSTVPDGAYTVTANTQATGGQPLGIPSVPLTLSKVPPATTGQVTITTPATGTQVSRGQIFTAKWTSLPGVKSYGLEVSAVNTAFTSPNAKGPDPIEGFGGAGTGFIVPGTIFTATIPPSLQPGAYQIRVIPLPLGGFTFSNAITVNIAP